MVSQSNVDQITKERIQTAASPLGNKKEKPNQLKETRVTHKPKYRTKMTFLNKIRYNNGVVGLFFGRRVRFIAFGFICGYGLRFWQNADEAETKKKEEEEKKKKKKNTSLTPQVCIRVSLFLTPLLQSISRLGELKLSTPKPSIYIYI